MISKDMYTLLSVMPSMPKNIEGIELLNGLIEKKLLNPTLGRELLETAIANGFIKASSRHVEHCYIELLYKGVIAIEEYENKQKSDDLMEKAYKTSQYAMWAAIASAIAAVVGLLCSMWELVLSAIEKIARMF